MNRRTLPPILLCALLATGCSWFGGDDKEPEEVKPASLTRFDEETELSVLWSRNIGKGADDRAVRILPAISGGRVFAACADGSIAAMQTANGRVIWEQNVKDLFTDAEQANAFTKDLDVITGGVGAAGDLVVVGTGSGHVIALNHSDGSLAWKIAASSEVLSQPVVDRNLVIVQSIDGKVTAYNAIDGSWVWTYSATTPALTLRGTSTPIVVGDLVIAGFANGRLAILDREEGLARMDQRIAVAEGESDLEKLVDIDGHMELTSDGKLYVASFQGRIVAIDISNGRLLWYEKASSLTGVGSGFGNVYLSHRDGVLSALDADGGREVWRVDALLHREITQPVTIDSYVAVTDFEGYVHLLAQSDGRFVGRRKVDGSGIKSGLVIDSGRIYALGDGGDLAVLELR